MKSLHILPSKEYMKPVFRLACPVVVGMAARTVMNLVDVAMVGRLGASQLAATGLSVHILMVVMFSFGAINVGVQAITARRYGEKEYGLCGDTVNKALLFVMMTGLFGSIAGIFAGPTLLNYFSNDPQVYMYGKQYIAIRFLEFFAFAASGIFRGFFDGIGKTSINMQAMVTMNVANIILNYLLIFGKFGFPRLEVTGAGIASMISSYIGLSVVIFNSIRVQYRQKYGLYRTMRIDVSLIKRLFRLSMPVIIQNFLVYLGFLLFLMMIGMISTIGLAASNVCIAIMSVSFMPGYGIGVAAATLVGQQLGAKQPDRAERFGWESLKLGVIIMGSMGVVFISIPDLILKIFTQDVRIIEEGIIALRILGFVQFFDAFGTVFGCCLQSSGMTRFVMVVEVVINWGIFLPLTYILGITFKLGTWGAWFSLAVYLFLFGIMMGMAFIKGRWKQVIV